MQLQQILETLDQRNPELRLDDEAVYTMAQKMTQRRVSTAYSKKRKTKKSPNFEVKGVSRSTWQNWKRLPRWEKRTSQGVEYGPPLVRPYATKLSLGQAIVLLAIAYSRIDPETLEPLAHTKPLPSDDQIWQIINSKFPKNNLLVGDFFSGAVGAEERLPGVGRTWFYTKELPAELEKRGYVGVSERSLYNKIPNLISGRRHHTMMHIETYCRALDAMNQRKAG